MFKPLHKLDGKETQKPARLIRCDLLMFHSSCMAVLCLDMLAIMKLLNLGLHLSSWFDFCFYLIPVFFPSPYMMWKLTVKNELMWKTSYVGFAYSVFREYPLHFFLKICMRKLRKTNIRQYKKKYAMQFCFSSKCIWFLFIFRYRTRKKRKISIETFFFWSSLCVILSSPLL